MSSRLVELLGQFIRARLKEKLETLDGTEFRCSFSGPPSAMLASLLESLVSPGQPLEIPVGGETRHVSLYLVRTDAIDPAGFPRSGTCTLGFLTAVRNARQVDEFLALHGLGEEISGTIYTTTEPIAFNAEHGNLEGWMREQLIADLFQSLFAAYAMQESDTAMAAVQRVLESAWTCDESNPAKPATWQVLERLAAGAPISASGGHISAAMALGLPACKEVDFGSKAHLAILPRLGALLESQGLGGGFEQLKKLAAAERADLVLTLDALRAHVERSCFEASEFAANPFAAYAPPRDESGSPPDWWFTLDTVAWAGLLDDGDDEVEDLEFDVALTNRVSTDFKGLPTIVDHGARFKLEVRGDQSSVAVDVSWSNGSKRFEPLGLVNIEKGTVLEIEYPVPEHQRFVRFKFEPLTRDGAASEVHAKTIKLIALDTYGPGIIAVSRTALKASPFKLNTKARDHRGKRCPRLEADMVLSGTGVHQVDILKGRDVAMAPSALGYEVTNDDEGAVERPINEVDAHHVTCLVETDEECYYDFWRRVPGDGDAVPCRLFLTADEAPPTGAASEFDRLVVEHRASAKGKHVNTRVESTASRLQDLEIASLSTVQSYRPLVLGPDFLDGWREPHWATHDRLTRLAMILDPRPSPNELDAPEAFLTAREVIRVALRGDPTQPAPGIQMLRLHEYVTDAKFAGALLAYLDSFRDWLARDYDLAAWCDVVSVHAAQAGGGMLETRPYAILLAPLHPIRLAWQVRSQGVLQEALQKHLRCPAASMMQPGAFPDCMALPVKSAAGTWDRKPYVAMASSSDYWSVLWATDSLDRLSNNEADPVFGGALGVLVEGLGSGFSEQQVARSMNEVSRLAAARSTLTVALSSETNGSSGCNEGIETWAREHLAGDSDAWHEAGGRSITVHDDRAVGLQPEPTSLASLTSDTGSTVQWFGHRPGESYHQVDLAIVAHLGTANREFQKQGLRSAIDVTMLSRLRLRKQLPMGNGSFVAEARVGYFPRGSIADPVSSRLADCVEKLENTCADVVDSYIFAPQIATLDAAIQRASYTAVSSSNLDAACFLGTTGRAYLWDYELPSYGRRPADNGGFFLLASKSPVMTRAMAGAVSKLSPGEEIGEVKARELLDEVSRRGMPTLKRLTSGGTMSLGEAGLLVALRFLQTEFDSSSAPAGLIPALGNGETVNIIIPVDPFAHQFDDLRVAFEGLSGERPDLLVMSLLFRDDAPAMLKITPLEVKVRATSTMTPAERGSAIQQARKFAEFLELARARSSDSELWGLAWANLLGGLLDYGFRVYGQLEQFMTAAEWSRFHQRTLVALLAREIPVVIDTRGRLIVIDSSSAAMPSDDDGDGFFEVLVMSRAEAFELLKAPGGNGFVEDAHARLGDWELVVHEGDIPSSGDGAALKVVTPHHPPKTSGSSDTESQKDDADEHLEVAPAPGSKHQTPEASVTNIGTETYTAGLKPVGIAFEVGVTKRTLRERGIAFSPGNTALNQLNVGIVGDLGTGKTQLVQALIYQLRRAADQNRGIAPNVLIFDYKRDYSKQAFVEAVGARVVEPFDLPLNLFDTRNAVQARNAWLERHKFFADVLEKIYGGIGPVQLARIKAAVKTAFDHAVAIGHSSPTLDEVFTAYAHGDAKIDTPYSIMSDLVDSEHFVKDRAKVIPFGEFATGVTVVDLAAVGQDDRTKNMLVAVFLNLFYEHMLKLEKKPFIGKDPSYRFVDTMLLVDEADNIMKYEFDVLRKILLQGREFGVGVLLASQYLSHFRTAHENYLEPLLTWFVHKVPNVSVAELAGIGLTRAAADMVESVKTLAVHHCLVKTLDVDGEIVRAHPFYELLEQSAKLP